MTSREFYLDRRRAEGPIFTRVLQAVPAAGLSYKPHDRSPTAEQVVWTMAKELKSCVDAATTFRGSWNADPPRPLPEMLALFEQWSKELVAAVERLDDSSWSRIAEFHYNGKKVSEQPVGQFLWFIHFDAIHHRGQLSAYIRPMGGTVPSIYGPSADSRSA